MALRKLKSPVVVFAPLKNNVSRFNFFIVNSWQILLNCFCHV